MAKNYNTYEIEDLEFTQDLKQDDSGPMIIVTSTFFIWGFITVMNGSLVLKLKEILQLNDAQTSLVNGAFFAAYFIVSLIVFAMSRYWVDPIERFGYKKTLIAGIFMAGVGCALFVPAGNAKQFSLFLIALFVLASGIAIMQIVANAYVCLLGHHYNSSSRLNLAQGFNSMGTAIAPIVGAYLILNNQSGAAAVQTPYLILAGALFVLGGLITMADMREDFYLREKKKTGIRDYPHLYLGVLAIFLYVGGEVSIGQHLHQFLQLRHIANLDHQDAEVLVALYWSGAMVGRFFGAAFMVKAEGGSRLIATVILLIFSFLVSYTITENSDLSWIFTILVLINLAAFSLGQNSPHKILGTFGTIVIGLLVIGICTSGQIAMWSIIAIGLFNSIMFPTIYSLAIKKLGVLTAQGSALLIMAIVGGAVIPLIQTKLAEITDIQISYLVPILCYAYVMYYGFKGYEIQRISRKKSKQSTPDRVESDTIS